MTASSARLRRKASERLLAALATPGTDRFWSKVDRSGGPRSCWLWTAACDSNGYGVFFVGIEAGQRRFIRASRSAWVLTHGVPPDEKPCVLHTCDMPACCNPEHLWTGTHGDNSRDMRAKGRHGYTAHLGVANGRAKLSVEDVAEIRRAYAAKELNQVQLAAKFGVANQLVSRIVAKKSWGHV